MSPASVATLSVVVVCLNSLSVLEHCLAALTAQATASDVEVIAVGRWHEKPEQQKVQAQYQTVRWLSVPDVYTVPLMRTHGMTNSHGDIVALLEDDCVVGDSWCVNVIATHQSAHDAIGGAIEPGDYRQAVDWAVYFCEYSQFMAPFVGVVAALPGNNVSYKRALIAALPKDAGFYDVFFHWQLQQSGKALIADSRLAVRNVNHWSWRQVTAMPYQHGRAFAAMRAEHFARWRRGLYAALSLTLPFVKTLRTAREVLARKRYVTRFVLSLPWVFLFMLSWSLGEMRGYLFGAGNSASQWR